MDTLEKDEFIKSFRNIVSQLKKKFVRRPNLVEAIESYGRFPLSWSLINYSESIISR